MKCPRCGSENINKNGHRRGKQNLIWALHILGMMPTHAHNLNWLVV
ncbi:MAG: hypothetical protein GDA56_31345 [Hormoscilla sp. GM7CHS1pb]|nr:hypothetical protein [Hormoscilla sp. GM7CHS1pb]